MSNTPRTDSRERFYDYPGSSFVVDSYFARELERELAIATEALKEIFTVGDGWGKHSPPVHYAGTNGDGHARCREIAEQALKKLNK